LLVLKCLIKHSTVNKHAVLCFSVPLTIASRRMKVCKVLWRGVRRRWNQEDWQT